jgi:polar amino acid transport system substrate-binding protein
MLVVQFLLGLSLSYGLLAETLSAAACDATLTWAPADACYWQTLTDELNKNAANSEKVEELLQTKAPELVAMLREDAKAAGLFDLWAVSRNFDDGAKAEIVSPAIVTAIGKIAARPMLGREVHAGLMHSYAYLLSNLLTPYGYKRERWTTTTIEDGFGLARATIAPVPQQGTLLANITALVGPIAFRYDAPQLAALSAAVKGASPELRDLRRLDLETLDLHRLTETVEIPVKVDPTSKAAAHQMILRTDVVRFPKSVKPADARLTHLLIYSVKDAANGEARLITVFPVEQSTVDQLFNPRDLGERLPVKARYNAVVPGISGQSLTGRRVAQVAADGVEPATILINDADWAPFFFAGAKTEPPGFAKEILQRCLVASGWNGEFRPLSIPRMRRGIEVGEVDINIYSHENGREDFLYYGSEPLFVAEYRPIVRADSPIKINKISDFDKLRLGYLIGLNYSSEFKAYIEKRRASGNLDITESEDSNLRKLVSGRIDIYSNSVPTSLWHAKKMGILDKIKVLDFSIKRGEYFVTFAKASKRLKSYEARRFLSAIDGCIRVAKKDGSYKSLVDYYKIEPR